MPDELRSPGVIHFEAAYARFEGVLADDELREVGEPRPPDQWSYVGDLWIAAAALVDQVEEFFRGLRYWDHEGLYPSKSEKVDAILREVDAHQLTWDFEGIPSDVRDIFDYLVELSDILSGGVSYGAAFDFIDVHTGTFASVDLPSFADLGIVGGSEHRLHDLEWLLAVAAESTRELAYNVARLRYT